MIKAVIFDWGGVLIENPSPGMIRYIAAFLGVAEEAFNEVDKKLLTVFQKGTVSEDTVWEKVCQDLNVSKPKVPSLWEEAFRRVYKPREKMFSLATALKKRDYKIGLLSNTEVPAMKFFYKQRYDMFDATVFSCAEGTVKPERRIYERALEKLEVRPQEAVFIDDRRDFIEGAREVNLNTILFKSPYQVIEELAYLSVEIG